MSKQKAKSTSNFGENFKEFDDLIHEITNKFQNFGLSFGGDVDSVVSIKNLFLLAFLVMLMIFILVIRKTLKTLTSDVKKL